MDEVCGPIRHLDEIKNYITPSWVSKIIPLVQSRTWVVSGKDSKCHESLEEWKPKVRMDRQSVPRTMVCHDMQGGYLEDRYVNGSADECSYVFYHWAVIDVFIYFSHHFITIPPVGWINAAHRHGVQILGTIITEWDEGKQMLAKILHSSEAIQKFVLFILYITEKFHLDGWFLNIENEVENVTDLKALVQLLASELHKFNKSSLLIWYDSVMESGQLKWQNELNDTNKCWFDLCDGIFLNYTWKEENLLKTVKAARHRRLDVYVGVDIFSRNCVGGMKSATSLHLIRQYGMSLALFAPGWTHETLPPTPKHLFRKNFETRDYAFWRSLLPYLYEHGPCRPFCTVFNKGVSKNGFNLLEQDLPMNPLLFGDSWVESAENNSPCHNLTNCGCIQFSVSESRPVLHGSVIRVSSEHLTGQNFHRLVICDIVCEGPMMVVLIVPKEKAVQTSEYYLLMQSSNRRQIILSDNNLDKGAELRVSYLQDTNKECFFMERFLNQTKLNTEWQTRFYKVDCSGDHILEIGIRLAEHIQTSLAGLAVLPYQGL